MLGHRYIIIAAIAGSLLSAAFASAKPLSKAERISCPNLRVCVDIIKRHDASEFDYTVLEREFERFRGPGRKALFDILESDAGNPDIANMILALGPLSSTETGRLNRVWSIEKAAQFLPLLKNNPDLLDKIILTLGHADPKVREAARQLVLRLPEDALKLPLESEVVGPFLTAMIKDPMPIMAPLVESAKIESHEELFAALIRSADTKFVAAAYNAMYRENPKMAFQVLLSEMRLINTPQQARAIGDVLVLRDKSRNDGFYLKFAKNLANDASFPTPARAAGLHAVITSGSVEGNPALSRRSKPLAFLVSQQGVVSQDTYVPALKRAGRLAVLANIAEISQSEKWINRDRITDSLRGTKLFNEAVRDLIRSDDVRSVNAGLNYASKTHQSDIQSQINHPITEIAMAATRALNLPRQDRARQKLCRLAPYDLDEMSNQMPFFDSAWFRIENGARVSAERKAVTSGHPTRDGWLAGYDLDKLSLNASYSGGGLVFFDNKTGDFRHIGDFKNPTAILPDRHLKLGQATSMFWIIDRWGEDASDMSLYRLDMSNGTEIIKHIGILPPDLKDVSVAPNGDFLVTFIEREKLNTGESASQPPLRYRADGRVSLACGSAIASSPNSTSN